MLPTLEIQVLWRLGFFSIKSSKSGLLVWLFMCGWGKRRINGIHRWLHFEFMQAFTARCVFDLIICFSRASSKVRLIFIVFLYDSILFIISGVITHKTWDSPCVASCYQVENAHALALPVKPFFWWPIERASSCIQYSVAVSIIKKSFEQKSCFEV